MNKMKNKGFLFWMFFILAMNLFFISFASAYVQTNVYSSQYNNVMGLGMFSGGQSLQVDQSNCAQGTDFMIQISPLGCTPTVVTSDLLEEQNVNVFCKMTALQMNPLVTVSAIDRISFDSQYPKEVLGIGYEPAQAALGLGVEGTYGTSLQGSLLLNNLGYVVITLRRQPNESALTNCEKSALGSQVCFVEGNLTATLKYDVKNSFGVGAATFYLPVLDDSEWQDNYIRYGFWDGRGYLRAKAVTDNSATLAIYSDNHITTDILSGQRNYNLAPYTSNIDLKVGETSNKIFLPGLSPCLGSLQLQLIDVENPDTVARIRVNDEYFELKQGESFLDDNKCTVVDFSTSGLTEKAHVNCQEDSGTTKLAFAISPKVTLSIDEDAGKAYALGDRLFQTGNQKKYVYLGYIGTYNKMSTTDNPQDAFVYLVAVPGEPQEKLSDSQLLSISTFAEKISAKAGKTWDVSSFNNVMKSFFSANIIALGAFVITGKDFTIVPYGQNIEVGSQATDIGSWKHDVQLKGFASTDSITDLNKNEQYTDYYKKAISDFDTDVNTFPTQIEDQNTQRTFGETALKAEIDLAYAVGQHKALLDLCKKFASDYPNSLESLDVCLNALRISSSDLTQKDVKINNVVKTIYFDGISQPSLDDYSATIFVQGAKKSDSYQLRKETPIQLTGFKETEEKTPEYISLTGLDTNSATIQLNLAGCIKAGSSGSDTRTDSIPLTKGGTPQTICGYTFSLTDIKLNKVAKVSIVPNIDFAKSNSTFDFKIAIEKRAIQLSPEQAKSKIIQLNKTISSLQKINNVIGTTVKVMKAACIGTEAYLTIKNIIASKDGTAIARQKVMTQKGGWDDLCKTKINDKKDPLYGKSLNQCFLTNSGNIEKDVTAMSSAIKSANAAGDNLNTQQAIADYSTKIGNSLSNSLSTLKNSKYFNSLTPDQQAQFSKTVSDVEKSINSDSTGALITKNVYTTDQLKDIQTYVIYLTNPSRSTTFDGSAFNSLSSTMTDIVKNSERYLNAETWGGTQKVDADHVILVSDKGQEQNQKIYQGDTIGQNAPNLKTELTLPDNTPIAFAQVGSAIYTLVLDNSQNFKYYPVKRIIESYLIYTKDGTIVTDQTIIDKLKYLVFQKVDSSDYSNEYKKSYGDSEPLVIYYDAPFQKLPEVVPIDLKQGWYAGIENPATSYDASGVVKQYWICNVGSDNTESFQVTNPMFGGDNCHLVIQGQIQTAGSIPAGLLNQAVNVITEVERAYKSGITKVNIPDLTPSSNHKTREIKVGAPASQTSSEECTDYWPVTDCTTLFNVCDPVVCPTSRCDLGGKYPVKNVIQSGIIGSIALCYPNAKWNGGDVYIPVCLSGINAGLEGFTSVLKAHADCLQKSIDTGETVGICDEIYSVYLCEFFWKQSLPVIKMLGQRIIDKITGQGTSGKGGGEYQNFALALKNAQSSIDYFTQYYAANSYRAFQLRSTEEVSSTICGGFASIIYPDSGSFLDRLISPDSPFQFIGKFSEDQLTTVTNPPTSHYKVWYHIYAGTDSGVYYSVYLRGSGSSYYQDTRMERMVASGYIPKGQYADETKDFTSPSGYTQLCINVNGQEECGFKEVTSSFAVDYLADMYANQTATKADITTQKDCTSGTASIYSLLDLNLQSMASNLLNPSIAAQGIIRTCSTQNPGAGIDEARWVKVGYCDDTTVGCWIDQQSVKDAINGIGIENQTLDTLNGVANTYLSANYMTPAQFEATKTTIKSTTAPLDKIALITPILDGNKAFYDYQKAYLYLERGKAYAQLAVDAYATYIKNKAAAQIPNGVPQEEDVRQQIVDKARSMTKDGWPFVQFNKFNSNEIAQIDKSNNIWKFDTVDVLQDYDNSGSYNCFDGVLHLYRAVGADFMGFTYCLKDGMVDVDKDGCSKDDAITKDEIKIGDILSIRYSTSSGPQPHSVVFLGWTNVNSGEAEIFDWLGPDDPTKFPSDWNSKNGYRTFRTAVITLKFDGKSEDGTVYAVGGPTVEINPNDVEPGGTLVEGLGEIFAVTHTDKGFMGTNFLSTSKTSYYQYVDGKWQWSTSPISGWRDIFALGAVTLNEVDIDIIASLQSLKSNLFEGGKTILKAAGGTAGVNGIDSIQISQPGLDVVTYSSPAFEFKTSGKNLCYRYFDGEWHWQFVSTGYDSLLTRTCDNFDFPQIVKQNWFKTTVLQEPTTTQDVNFLLVDKVTYGGQTINGKSAAFIQSLQGKSYLEGLDLLMKRTVTEGASIATAHSSMSSSNVFDVDIGSTTQYYKYSETLSSVNGGWQWAFSPYDAWSPTTTYVTVATTGSNVGKKASTDHIALINSISGKNFLTGAVILFDPASSVAKRLSGTSVLQTSTMTSRDESKLATLMNSISTSKTLIGGGTCICGINCNDYAQAINDAANQYGIPDPLLLLAIMIQESSCNSKAQSSSGDYGLMQVNTVNCVSSYGLPSDEQACQQILLGSPETNINVGAHILIDKFTPYASSSKTYTCLNPSETYSGWEAALRGYNGWGCTGDNTYVSDVKTKYNQLVTLYASA